ncbi:peptidase [Allokutzneria sp. A3M-2-11 16]|nr:trypsin-like serine protease [Allokutzneria sp. A3M-2-11 16]MCP3805315.1 peptidase [Allokutzneria sp. A3M-2-11 16]
MATHSAATTAAEERRVLDYWTDERMRTAVPMEQLVKPQHLSGKGQSPGVGLDNGGPAESVPETLPVPMADQLGAPWGGSGAIVKTTGRVFFTMGDRNGACSGSAVTSANKDVVITAGHCVKYQGAFHTNWVFVPGYTNGSRPHGTFAARKLVTTPQWQSNEDINYDVAAAAVNPVDGRHLTDVVGGQGVLFNQPRNQKMHAFGYPAADPYDGERLIYCSGTTFPDPFKLTNDLGMNCNMTPGSSGGPWFLGFNEGTGLGKVNSVNSVKMILLPWVMFGPYFGNDAKNVYNTAVRS